MKEFKNENQVQYGSNKCHKKFGGSEGQPDFFYKWPVGRILHFCLQWLTGGSGHQTFKEKVVKQTTKNIITYILEATY